MSLSWPWALIALSAVPLLLLAWWLTTKRRRRVAVRVSNVALIRAALPGRSRWRRRIPVFLFLLGLLTLAFSTARPQASVAVPSNSTSILLAIDVSASMCSTDVPPNRLTVAQEAAREFVRAQEDGTSIGLVAFSGVSGLLVEPTENKQELLAAIDTLKTGRGTAIGMAILAAIDAISEINPDVAPIGIDDLPATGPSGEYEPDTIVVLTDGANTQGVDPITAAEQAAGRNVRVYTIGFGTTEPSPMMCTAEQIGGGMGFRGDGRGRFGGGVRRGQLLDEHTLTQVADMTGGRYFRAEDSEQLVEVMTDLPTEITLQRQNMEITSWFALAGALLLATAITLSLHWNRSLHIPTARPPAT